MQASDRNTSFFRLCVRNLLSLIVLNLLFLLTCLPVLTLPAGWTALSSACQHILLEEKGLYRRFWRDFCRNFFPSLLFGAVFFAGPALALCGCRFYYRLSEGAGIAVALSCFCLIGSYLLLCVGAFAFQMQARVTLRVSDVLKNAVCLTFRTPRVVLGWLLLSVALAAALVLLLPYSLPWVVLLGGSLPCFAATRGVLPIIDAYIVKE